jgi:hypothetical protein
MITPFPFHFVYISIIFFLFFLGKGKKGGKKLKKGPETEKTLRAVPVWACVGIQSLDVSRMGVGDDAVFVVMWKPINLLSTVITLKCAV